MKNGNDAIGNWTESISGQCPYGVVGSDRMTSLVWKVARPGGGWSYHFNLCRCCSETGQVDQRFKPEDLLHLIRLIRLLAIEIVEDGCLEAALRLDLRCIATGLGLFKGGSAELRWFWMDDEVADSLMAVLEYVWDDERTSYKQSPSDQHIFTRLQVLDSWIRGELVPKSPFVTEGQSDKSE